MVLTTITSRVLCLLALLVFSSGSIAQTYTLKFATLMPTGTSWTKLLDEWVQEVEEKSEGRLKFRMYPGGVMGDEPDVLRKIRKGQLHGGMFTGYGIGRIYSPARVLEVPFLFKNTDESDYVRTQMMPELEAGFSESGFELLGWPEVGFIHFFSKQPVRLVDDLRKQKVFVGSGSEGMIQLWRSNGFHPVALAMTDVMTGLQTGMIEAMPSTPLLRASSRAWRPFSAKSRV